MIDLYIPQIKFFDGVNQTESNNSELMNMILRKLARLAIARLGRQLLLEHAKNFCPTFIGILRYKAISSDQLDD